MIRELLTEYKGARTMKAGYQRAGCVLHPALEASARGCALKKRESRNQAVQY